MQNTDIKQKKTKIAETFLKTSFFVCLCLFLFLFLFIPKLSHAFTFLDDTESEFNLGTYFSTQWDSVNSWLELDNASTGGQFPDNGVSNDWFDMSNNVMLYHMNETGPDSAPGGTDFEDKSGNGRHGTATSGIVYGQSGKLDKASQFNGTSHYIDSGTYDPMDTVNKKVTMSAWVFDEGVTSAADMIFSKGTDVTANSFGIMVVSGNTVRVWAVGSSLAYATSTATIQVNTWNHVVGVIDGNNIYIYLNGQLAASGTYPGTISASANPVTVGRQHRIGLGYYFHGKIDEVAIFNDVLTDDEILDLYNRGSTRLKYQVRSCDDASCSGESFIGPDGTNSTYYSELNNGTLTLPTLSLTNVLDNQYFQYQAFFESDNASYSPELNDFGGNGTDGDDDGIPFFTWWSSILALLCALFAYYLFKRFQAPESERVKEKKN